MKYIIQNDELYHHGVDGQKWGVRRYQNYDGTLTPEGRQRLEEADTQWAKNNYNKIYTKAYKSSKHDIKRAVRRLNWTTRKRNANGRISMNYVNAYNQKLADIMTKNISDIRTPNLGRAIKFVAKRGEVGVHMAIADEGYDMSQLKRGVYGSGRIAYRKAHVNTA